MREAGKWPTLEIKGDCKTIVDWVHGHAKVKTRISTVADTQNLQGEWWSMNSLATVNRRVGRTHTVREHNREADQWADKGAKGRVEEWVDTTRIAWPEVPGLCGFGDGSCDNGNCGGGIVIAACSDVQGWSTFFKKCGPVPGGNSLDAELGAVWYADGEIAPLD